MRGDGGHALHARDGPLGSPPHAWGRHEIVGYHPLPHRFTPTCVGTAAARLLCLADRTVHPHMRGDGGRTLCFIGDAPGSPPHAWGRRPAVGVKWPLVRFTPTCVGTALRRGDGQAPAAVHPHMRGDGGLLAAPLITSSGSPPHAWGRPANARRAAGRYRFTPTCVGTAGPWTRPKRTMSVHPHMRGDGSGGGQVEPVGRGSPPHAWGRPIAPNRAGDILRFTPTCVGTAPPSSTWTVCAPVHPHMRGDGVINLLEESGRSGSPPHAWGRRMLRTMTRSPTWFTPTCVGTAMPSLASSGRAPVHPHMRGDGQSIFKMDCQGVGSPPHAWGRLHMLCPRRPGSRFTPTCVGTAVHARVFNTRLMVHPHMRGDGVADLPVDTAAIGSPPHAWGRHHGRGHRPG